MLKKKKLWFLTLLAIAFASFACQTSLDSLPNEEKKTSTYRKPIKKHPVALVLGGGGAKGIAHVAAIEVLEEAGIPIDYIVGCSSGSIVGALYASRVDIKTIRQLLFDAKAKQIVENRTIPKRLGFMKHDRLREFLEKNLKATDFSELQIPLTVVATDLMKGDIVAFEDGALAPAIVASSSVPVLFEPVKYDNKILVDGGVVAALPVTTAKEKNPAMIIAIDISNNLPEETPGDFISIANRSLKIMHKKLSKLQQAEADIVISPTINMATLEEDEKKRKEFYLSVKKEMQKKLPEIKRLYYKKVQSQKTSYSFFDKRPQV